VQAGNNGLAIAVIWVLGGLIMYKLGRWHIPIAFIAAFVPLAFLRAGFTGHPWQTELAPITSPMFQLYIFFMITDPQTTTRAKWSQILVAVLVACMETTCRLVWKDVHSLYHALFTVGPAANLVEIVARRVQARRTAPRMI
jgi:Na+-translocating ferredoxin:NAD+ oxidoreductase RnfD subunit